MEEIKIQSYQPVLDVFLLAINNIMKKRVKLKFSAVPEMAGLLVDTTYVMYAFCPFTKRRISYDGKIIYESKNDSDYFLEFSLDSTLKYYEEKKNYEPVTLIVHNKKNKKIAAFTSLVKKPKKREHQFFSSLKKALKKILPEEKNKISIKFVYGFPFDFRVIPPYQDFDFLLRDSYYPVSSEKSHMLIPKVWNLIAQPVYWRAKSNLLSLVFDEIIGKRSREETLDMFYKLDPSCSKYKKYPEKCKLLRETLSRALDEGKLIVYQFVDAYIDGKEFSEICKKLPEKFRPSPLYEGLLFSLIGKAILCYARKGARGDIKERQGLENLIEAYNKEHSSVSGRKIDIRNFMEANKIQMEKMSKGLNKKKLYL